MKRFSYLIVFGYILIAAAAVSAAIPDPVKLDSGLVSGAPVSGSGVRAFKGIPFAAPPVGPLRWRAPQPVMHWDGVRKAEEFGPRCMQGGVGGGGARGGARGAVRGGAGAPTAPAAPAPAAAPATPATSEDCLYVNVWTGANSASERRPVMVFAYGGGFTSGAGSEPRYDGEALAKKGVVFITFNYRLGMFGFFAHPVLTKVSGHNASGNYAFMDLIEVLRWVQRNATSFGGDPKRVTIMGESAGAFMVSALSASPHGKGLFHRVIAESGAWMGLGIAKMTPLAQAEKNGKQLAMTMGVTTIAELRAKSADEIQRSGRSSGVIMDGWIVPEDLSVTFAQGRQNEVDVLVGSNQDEGTFLSRGSMTAQQFTDQARQRFAEQADAFLKLYPASSDTEASASELGRVRDELAWHMRTWAKLQAKKGKSKAYVFYFTRTPPGTNRGATHTAELSYVFNNLAPTATWTDLDRKLADTMSSYWANFAATGDPNGKGLPVWPAFKEKGGEMVLGDKVEAGPGLEPAPIAFFDAAYAKQQEKRGR